MCLSQKGTWRHGNRYHYVAKKVEGCFCNFKAAVSLLRQLRGQSRNDDITTLLQLISFASTYSTYCTK